MFNQEVTFLLFWTSDCGNDFRSSFWIKKHTALLLYKFQWRTQSSDPSRAKIPILRGPSNRMSEPTKDLPSLLQRKRQVNEKPELDCSKRRVMSVSRFRVLGSVRTEREMEHEVLRKQYLPKRRWGRLEEGATSGFIPTVLLRRHLH